MSTIRIETSYVFGNCATDRDGLVTEPPAQEPVTNGQPGLATAEPTQEAGQYTNVLTVMLSTFVFPWANSLLLAVTSLYHVARRCVENDGEFEN